jgi:hypothetical protein
VITVNVSVRLAVEWKINADQVVVTYRVTNGGSASVYVIDGGLTALGGGKMKWSDRLKVGFISPETAVLGSRLTPLDPRVHSMYPPETYGVCVKPGDSHQSTLTAPLPLVADGMTTEPPPPPVVMVGSKRVAMYSGDPPQLADQPIVCRAARFELGVIPHDESLQAAPIHLAGRDVYRLAAAAWSLQQLVAVEKRPIELPMLLPATLLPTQRSN